MIVKSLFICLKRYAGVKPGVQYAYRVKAQRAGQESPYSNIAVVYMT